MATSGVVALVGAELACRLGVPERLAEAGENDVRLFPDLATVCQQWADLRVDVGVVVADSCAAALDPVARWHAHARQLPILVLAAPKGCEDAVPVLAAGAQGVASSLSDASGLQRVLHAMRSGEAVIPRRTLARLVDDLRRRPFDVTDLPPRHPLRRLSPRELGVLRRLAEGATTAEVAAAEGIESATVRAHLSRALHKLRMTREEAQQLFTGRL
jgi:DNA-binding NarL/FixJ family response regulator